MCGLFGVVSGTNLGKPEKDMFELLAFLSYLRGKDSTGIISLNAAGAVSTNKATVAPPEFFSMGKSKAIMAEYTLRALFGHTRAATVGNNVHSNAHPFEFENVVGMHNGTLDHMCRAQYTNKPVEYGTDSEGLYSKINESSVEEVIPQLEGAWALTMWDKAQRKLRIVRNDKRTLFVLESVDKRTMFWASEIEFLVFAANRLNYPAARNEEGDYLVKSIPANSHWSIALLDRDAKWSMTPLESKKVYTSTTFRRAGYQGSYYDNLEHRNTANTNAPAASSNVVPIRDTRPAEVIDYRKSNSLIDPSEFKPVSEPNPDGETVLYIKSILNEKIYEDEFNHVTDKACVECGKPIKFEDGALIVSRESAAQDFVGVCFHCLEKDPFMVPLLKDKVG